MDYVALITQVGFPSFILYVIIKEISGYLKSRKNGNGDYSKEILNELQLMNSNHLHGVEKAITAGNEKIVDAIHNMHMDLIKEFKSS